MCFSASASFGAAAVLLLLFMLVLKHIRSRREIVLGLTPLLFAIQQTAEGVVWLTYNQPSSWLYSGAAYIFLGFAFIVWPIWAPLSLWLIEKKQQKRRLLFMCLLIGCIVALFSAIHMFIHGATAHVLENHINYDIRFPLDAEYTATVIYMVSTVVPFFITSAPYFWVYGVAVLIFYGISLFFWHTYLISVWCFFAALLSLLMYRFVRLNR
jgi:hypothetical protein